MKNRIVIVGLVIVIVLFWITLSFFGNNKFEFKGQYAAFTANYPKNWKVLYVEQKKQNNFYAYFGPNITKIERDPNIKVELSVYKIKPNSAFKTSNDFARDWIGELKSLDHVRGEVSKEDVQLDNEDAFKLSYQSKDNKKINEYLVVHDGLLYNIKGVDSSQLDNLARSLRFL